ncbi:hypothetical protein GC089_12320 [Cellulomonas sp. JZ18]|uniref:DUF7878 domain-containing protein n=1 Tax=Cellulomonas sp. JZ18 TaxID=2654191 RepID=UPI0012D4A93C|nr:hypothetical protein [Cellulomonas sp. JZ18]QGQ19859.1 hypothetical protein GC089_12320 [Cellulomonas sp. JZ18]
MQFHHEGIDFSELGGDLVTDYLVSVQADLTIVDRDVVIYDEPCFPVAELAWSLTRWLRAVERQDFRLDSLSSSLIGLVTIAREGNGWVVFSEQSSHVRSGPVSDDVIEACARDFISSVSRDLTAYGVDPDRIIG